jgi:hypothetical protein
MKPFVNLEEYIVVCECKGIHRIIALYDNNILTVNGIPRFTQPIKMCTRCGKETKRIYWHESDFENLMGLRRYFRYQYVATKKIPKEMIDDTPHQSLS